MGAKEFIEIIRPLNCIMAAFGVFIGYSIALNAIAFNTELYIAMLVAFLVCAAGIALNDVFDAKVDEKLHPEKPIPSKRLSARTALLYSNALFLFANLLAFYYLLKISFAIAFAFTLLFIAYSKYLTKIKYAGNWVVASGTAFTLIFGASLIGNYSIAAFFAIAALLANAAREIVKDIEDIKQDKGFKVSLPMIAGIPNAKYVAIVCASLAIVISYVPKFLGFGGMAFLTLLTVANLGFVLSVRYVSMQNYSKAQRAFKAAMFLALVAFLLGVVA